MLKNVKQVYPIGVCYCGCGTKLASNTKFFAPGHDKAAESEVIKKEYGSVAAFIVHHGYGPLTKAAK